MALNVAPQPVAAKCLAGSAGGSISKEMSTRKPEAEPAPPPAAQPEQNRTPPKPEEIGGRKGPDPTRYGDWEKDGRCVDF